MPSPFPGMDPYLEHPANWRDVHQSFIAELRVALNVTLPPGFVARTEQRLYVVEPDSSTYPDVTVARRLPGRVPAPAGLTTALVADTPVVYTLAPEEVTEPYIEIRSTDPEQHVVAAIEVLSPSNKSRGRGREAYTENRYQLLRSDIHLLEIDLLRDGEVTIAAGGVQQPGREYLVCLHRGDGKWRFETWSFGLQERLPRVTVPLTEGSPDVVLDLQAILAHVYDSGRYAETLDYSADPRQPLTEADRLWMDNLLRAAGLRAQGT